MARNHFWGAALFTVFVKGAGFAICGRKTRTLENRKGAAPGAAFARCVAIPYSCSIHCY
jgi:hypothetical protein